MGEFIAEVTSHEAGHMLGLSHVSNLNALMDSFEVWSGCTGHQFTTSPIHPDVFRNNLQNPPVLFQNSRLLIDLAVGPR